jgi:ParB family chromosome partitioning protein
MTNPSAVRNIPLSKLVLSPGNVRKTPPSPAEEAELKASIKARGLKQNLVVHPSADEKGVHAVTAGGRRLKALQKLAGEGVIPADFKVPCLDGLTVRDQEPEISNPSLSTAESIANLTCVPVS